MQQLEDVKKAFLSQQMPAGQVLQLPGYIRIFCIPKPCKRSSFFYYHHYLNINPCLKLPCTISSM